MGWIRNMVIKLLKIQPALDTRTIIIKEPLSHRANVMRNRLWYRGDPSELDQFYKQTALDAVSKSRFWAAVPSDDLYIRKIHSGLPAMIVDRLSDIVISDMDSIDLETEQQQNLWDAISEDNDFPKLLGEGIADTLIAGDGAFKVSVDTDISNYPLVEFFSGDQVEYKRKRGRLQEIIFFTDYTVSDKDRDGYNPGNYSQGKEYRLQETYGPGYVTYKLFDIKGKEVPLDAVPELAGLADATYTGDFIMAVPLQFFKSPKWPGRGKSILDNKADNFDALDEVISQWVDAIRAGRVQKYLPEDLIPRDPKTGALIRPNPFDNQFLKLNQVMAEKDKANTVDVVQPAIAYEAFVASYASTLDMCLQGIISPATLGSDLKKLDNAEAQREKEKATLYTRGKLIDALNQVIPQLVDIVLKVYDTMKRQAAKDYVASVTFGEYAAPDFGAVVEVVSKAKLTGIMSLEQAVDELYGDRWTDEEKAEEALRLKQEQGMIQADEPKSGDDADDGAAGGDDGGAGEQ